MNSKNVRYAFSSSVAAAMLAGCGGSQPPIGAPGAMPQSRAIATHAGSGGSWMLPEAKSEELVYLAGDGKSYVVSYRTGKLVGMIDNGAGGVCSDANGNVFLTTPNAVYEYAHGGTTPIASFSVAGDTNSCSVDPATGNLAVTVFDGSGGYNVAIFKDASGPPTTYSDDIDLPYCGYDKNGNLFTDGFGSSGTALTELPAGGGSFENITVSPSIALDPGTVQWDGRYITVEGGAGEVKRPPVIYRLRVSGSGARVIGTTRLKLRRPHFTAQLSWIQGGAILAPFSSPGHGLASNFGVWPYPRGGKPLMFFKKFNSYLNGVTVSIVRAH